MIPVLQCGGCKFGKTLKWVLPQVLEEGADLRRMICSQYPDGIPTQVRDSIEDCPKFEEKAR